MYTIPSRSFAAVDDFSTENIGSYKTEAHMHFLRLIHDSPHKIAEKFSDNDLLLEGYFNDLYKLFLRKLSEFECRNGVDAEDIRRLKGLLDEMIKVKDLLLVKSDEAAEEEIR